MHTNINVAKMIMDSRENFIFLAWMMMIIATLPKCKILLISN